MNIFCMNKTSGRWMNFLRADGQEERLFITLQSKRAQFNMILILLGVVVAAAATVHEKNIRLPAAWATNHYNLQ